MAKKKLSRHRPAARQVSSSRPQSTNAVLICLLLIVLVCVVFGQTLRHEFINYDDDRYITENAHVQNGLTWPDIKWAFSTGYTGYAHPVTWLSHQLDYELYHGWAGGHHLTSLILHAANSVLLFLFLLRTTRKVWSGAFVAAIFAIHPLHVESVAWVAERKDVLSGLFFLLTLHAYAAYAAQLKVSRYLLALFFFAAGILSKPMLVTVPFLLLLLDYWPLGRIQPAEIRKSKIGRLILEKIPFLFIAVVWSAITVVLQQKYGAAAESSLSFGLRSSNAIASYGAYLWSSIWPQHLAVFYPYPAGLWWGTVLFCAALVILISILCISRWRKSPYLITGWLWFLGMLVPVIGFIQVGQQARADRYMYLPQIGLCVMAAWGIMELLGERVRQRRIVIAASLLLIAAFTALGFIQTSHWRNNDTLWRHALAVTSRNYVAENNLGNDLVRRRQTDEAVVHFRRSLEINPSYPEANNNLGSALANEGRWTEATDFYETALRSQPENAKTHSNIGVSLTETGRLDEALTHLREALRIDPDSAEAHFNLARTLLYSGKRDEAVAEMKQAARLQPNNAEIKARVRQIGGEL